LKARNDNYGRRRIFACCSERSEKIRNNPLSILRWELDGGYTHFSPSTLDLGTHCTGDQYNRKAKAEKFKISG
jgi:hypothetical protein